MSWMIYIFGSGMAFFLGIGMLVVGVSAFWLADLRSSHRNLFHRIAAVLSLVGLAITILSAAPLPYWFYALGAGLTIGWLLVEKWKPQRSPFGPTLFRIATLAVWLAASLYELPYQRSPRITFDKGAIVYVIGDSLSADLGQDVAPWPRLVAASCGVEVVNFSVPGATTQSALRQAAQLPNGGIVLVEIGGNDLLDTTRAYQFEKALDRLLNKVCRHDRTVLMFELPLPPLYNEFGRAQRRQAKRHGAVLIPKRVLIRTLSGQQNTVDSLHLTSQGHQHLADSVRQILPELCEN